MNFKQIIISSLLLIVAFSCVPVSAQVSEEKPHVEVSLSPRSGSYVAGSTFEVPLLINTNGASINSIDIKVNFDHTKLSVVEPSGGKSFISFWSESPKYNNLDGTIRYIGTISEGFVSESGLVAMITFKALSSGATIVDIDSSSKIYLNDDLDTIAIVDLGRGEYNILNKASEGVQVFSETHPFENKWYNNNSPIVSWNPVTGASGYSFVLDNKPFTVPDNVVDSTENTAGHENLTDGLWYFHIKAQKPSGWGNTGHFIVRIDTAPLASFTPTVNSFSAAAILSDRNLISFFTTDNLSGVDHYEVASINSSQSISDAPVFIEASSPFPVPVIKEGTMKVIVRAFDQAGNVSEGFVEVSPALRIVSFVKENWVAVLLSLLLLLLAINYIRKYGIISKSGSQGNFSELEQSINRYIERKKELDKQNTMEREQIQTLEKDLESIK